MSTPTDILQRLQQLAPDPDALDARWPAGERADLARRILAEETDGPVRLRHLPAPRRPRRRTVAISLAAAAAVAVIGAVVVPSVLPEGSPGAASPAAADALHRLADVAADTPADTFGPGQFVHTIRQTQQVGVPENPELGAVTYDIGIEEWTAYDGRSWSRRTSPGDTPTTYYTGAYRESGAAYFASLPTDPDDLARYLRDHTSGSSSKAEAVFLRVGDVLENPTAPAALRSAAATVLAETDHVSLGAQTTDSEGRTVQEFDFIDESIRPGQVQSFLVDPGTAQVIGRRSTQPGSSYAATSELSEVVGSVPAAVVASACPVNGPITATCR